MGASDTAKYAPTSWIFALLSQVFAIILTAVRLAPSNTNTPPGKASAMTHLVAVGGTGSKIPQEDKDTFAEKHPDCLTMYTGTQEFGVGWRYSSKENKMEWYAKAAEAFKYPHAPNKTGWYL